MSFDAPENRVEAALQNMLGADNVLDPPQSRIEVILHNMLGASYEMEPPQSRIEVLLREILEQGVGGNPNSVETITGTLDDPFGEHSIAELVDAISSNNATVKMAVSMGQMTGVLPISADVELAQLYCSLCGMTVSGGSATVILALQLAYEGEGLLSAGAIISGQYTDLVPQASYIQTETTIIWHPLPKVDS